jgi:hypothetical protein
LGDEVAEVLKRHARTLLESDVLKRHGLKRVDAIFGELFGAGYLGPNLLRA